ncbi:protein-L-isoaspartate(D-aspartate) O-methyltransferase-like [Diaphorina citri]|uniref:protein-L-isoaspartate(D-aspartate) O-methyltransferase n=1 Tax=Diaphorina citri TaxID=121845 RepID=A0A1S3CVA7_DIACI|nr:protein-L-isoaspartate(D-aspartate) O-methyltransferase-like [Diaphorina citri]
MLTNALRLCLLLQLHPVQRVTGIFHTNDVYKIHLTQDELIDHLIEYNHIKSRRVEEAMRYVLRDHFIKPSFGDRMYNNVEKDLGYETFMESPNHVAHILEHLKPWLHCRSKVLDIGSGSGYLSALFAYMGAKVYAIEHVKNLCKRAMKNIRRGAPAIALAENFEFVCADGRRGYPDAAPYDVIYISQAIRDIPWHIVDQLKLGGRMLFIKGHEDDIMTLELLDKFVNGSVKTTVIHPHVYIHELKSLEDQKRMFHYYNTPPPQMDLFDGLTPRVEDLSIDWDKLNISEENFITERPCDVIRRSTSKPLVLMDPEYGWWGPLKTRKPGT